MCMRVCIIFAVSQAWWTHFALLEFRHWHPTRFPSNAFNQKIEKLMGRADSGFVILNFEYVKLFELSFVLILWTGGRTETHSYTYRSLSFPTSINLFHVRSNVIHFQWKSEQTYSLKLIFGLSTKHKELHRYDLHIYIDEYISSVIGNHKEISNCITIRNHEIVRENIDRHIDGWMFGLCVIFEQVS